MFRVYINPKEERVLVTKLRVAGEGWVLVTKYATWEKAYRKALYIANKLDYVLEWFLEDQIEEALQVFKN
ncbi:hypothetical protein [Pyrobaculum neutrophilum]|uniref:Uncharacterized protein n=1 Tax=Pyrobaculum neutrophilum (strain DSM 2338 / JCM 9278 / NBRC 100436 / V24Sta) TaxID=444157 RepID=B1YDB1_PYRNV|nr:hypothetical protein [Pyrobaculum neutrophilum]ACB39774.1 conserved hypothetical protein [Pyrobaculum neutrophilum V24Sta]